MAEQVIRKRNCVRLVKEQRFHTINLEMTSMYYTSDNIHSILLSNPRYQRSTYNDQVRTVHRRAWIKYQWLPALCVASSLKRIACNGFPCPFNVDRNYWIFSWIVGQDRKTQV